MAYSNTYQNANKKYPAYGRDIAKEKISKVQNQIQFKDFIIRKCVFFQIHGKI